MADDPSGEIARLRSELRTTRSDLSDLKQQVNRINRLDGRVRELEDTVPPALAAIIREQEALKASVDGHRKQYEQDQMVASAYQELAIAERRHEQRYGRYQEARDMAASIIDAVGSGHIDRAVIVDVTERLAIKTPNYWVAPATVAIAAWLDDNHEQHRDALDYAMALDPGKTALFMALVLRDQSRDQALQEWLDFYLSRLTPENLPRHFQVVIDAVTGGALGNGAAPRLVRRMGDWYTEAEGRQDIADAAVAEWKRRLLSLGARAQQGPDLSRLAASEQAWRLLRARHEANRAIEQAGLHFRQRFELGADVSSDVSESLATLLRELAATPDPAEEEYLDAISENRAITQTRDRAAARAKVAAEKAGRTGTLNIISMVSRAAFPTSAAGPVPDPSVTELLAIMLSGRLIAAAADSLRAELPPVGTLEFSVGVRGWPCRFSCDYQAATTRPALRRQAADQAKQVCDQIQKESARRQGLLRGLRKWACPAGLAAAAALAGTVFLPTVPPELMAPAVVVAVPSILGFSRLPKVVRRATDRVEAEKRVVTGEINQVADQLADLWDADRRSADIDLPGLRGRLTGLTEDDVIAATHPLEAVPLPRTRKLPSWTPRPPRGRVTLEPVQEAPAVDG